MYNVDNVHCKVNCATQSTNKEIIECRRNTITYKHNDFLILRKFNEIFEITVTTFKCK